MPLKFVSATELKVGSIAVLDDAPCAVRSIDISKTGKHGASKVRIEAISVLDDKKHVIVAPGSEKIAIPMIDKRKAQVLSINQQEKNASLMDLESFETLTVTIAADLLETISDGVTVEYWNVEGKLIIKRIM
jgi:translation initiation factor 5A